MKVSHVGRFVASARCVIDIDYEPPTVCDIGAVAGDPLLQRTVLRCLLQVDDPERQELRSNRPMDQERTRSSETGPLLHAASRGDVRRSLTRESRA